MVVESRGSTDVASRQPKRKKENEKKSNTPLFSLFSNFIVVTFHRSALNKATPGHIRSKCPFSKVARIRCLAIALLIANGLLCDGFVLFANWPPLIIVALYILYRNPGCHSIALFGRKAIVLLVSKQSLPWLPSNRSLGYQAVVLEGTLGKDPLAKRLHP